MAFSSAGAIMGAAWHWLGVNSLPILIATYFVAMAAAVLLSLYVHGLSQHLRQLRQKVERDARRIEQLEISLTELEGAVAATPPLPPAAEPTQSAPFREKPDLDPAMLRSELESVLSELWDDPDSTPHDR